MRKLGLFTTLIAVGLALSGCAMRADDTNADGEAALAVGLRTNWQTEHWSFFTQVPGDPLSWVEEAPGGGRAYFREIGRTSEYVELHSTDSRDLYMRLYDGYAQFRFGNSGPWNTWEHRGHWV